MTDESKNISDSYNGNELIYDRKAIVNLMTDDAALFQNNNNNNQNNIVQDLLETALYGDNGDTIINTFGGRIVFYDEGKGTMSN